MIIAVADAEDAALLDVLDEFATTRFTEAMRCRPSAAGKLPLYPARVRLPHLAETHYLLYSYDGDDPTAETLLGYCVIDRVTGLIRWLVCVYELVAETVLQFCERAKSDWSLQLHGSVENPIVHDALLMESNIIEVGDEIVYDG